MMCKDSSLITYSYSCCQWRKYYPSATCAWQVAAPSPHFVSRQGLLLRTYFWVSHSLPLACNMPLVAQSSKFRSGKYDTKATICKTVQRCSHKWNGDLHQHAILLEPLISIRICSRDPGLHILAKWHLVGTGSDPFAWIHRNGGGDMVFGSNGLSSVLSLAPNNLKIFYTVESLQSHFILTMFHWSCGLPVCFSSQGT